jgi:hypothetical protein
VYVHVSTNCAGYSIYVICSTEELGTTFFSTVFHTAESGRGSMCWLADSPPQPHVLVLLLQLAPGPHSLLIALQYLEEM